MAKEGKHALLALPSPVASQISLMPKIGTPGLGIDLGVRVHSWIVIRAGGALIPYEPAFTVADVDYSVEIPATGVAAVDLHLGGTGFRVSGGVFYLTDDVVFNADFSGSVELGDTEWTVSEVGSLRGTVAYEDLSPFLSVGYGHASGRGAGIFLELGAAFIGEPGLELVSDGGSETGTAALNAALQAEAEQAEDDLADASIYPILNIGVRIGF